MGNHDKMIQEARSSQTGMLNLHVLKGLPWTLEIDLRKSQIAITYPLWKLHLKNENLYQILFSAQCHKMIETLIMEPQMKIMKMN